MSGFDPIIVGVGQITHKSENFLHPLHAMMRKEWIGTRGNVIGQKGKINVVDF